MAVRKRFLSLPALLGMAHMIADGTAGFMLGTLSNQVDLTKVGILFLLYNLLAFAAQPILGACCDRGNCIRSGSIAGLWMLVVAVPMMNVSETLAIALAGLGSACFHVGAGALAVSECKGRAYGAGLFAAPGVLGLAIGGILATSGYDIRWTLFVGLIFTILLLFFSSRSIQETKESVRQRVKPEFEKHDLIMLLLLTGIALRSALWTAFQYVEQGLPEMLLAMAAAAAIGKALGGYMADWLGWRIYTTSVLLLATPLLLIGRISSAAFLVGIALLQSATPVTLAAMIKLLPRSPATASGLALGLGIAVGGFPAVLGMGAWISGTPGGIIVITLASALTMWFALRSRGMSLTGAVDPA